MLMKKTGTKLKFNITFLAIDGHMEKVNIIMNQCFCNYITNDHKHWGDHLGLVEFCYNSTKHLATKLSPFELALGVEVKQPIDPAIFRIRGTRREGDKEAKEKAK
jgi:hypothetical protein